MRKPLLIGGGLGLLVLVLVAGGFWLADRHVQPGMAGPFQAERSDRAAMPGSVAAQASSAWAGAASQPHSPLASQERRRRLAEVRAEFNALRAKGADAPPERMRAVVDELEALSPPGFDPRYFQALRNMLDASTRVQLLNKELQDLSKSTTPKDAARQEAILGEMRTLGEKVGVEARNLQAYAPKPPSGAKSP